MAFSVGHHETPALIRKFDNVVVIATSVATGLVISRQLHPLNFGKPFREEVVLYLGNHLEFPFQGIFLGLDLTSQPVNSDVGIYPGDHLFCLERLRDVIHCS